MNKAVAKTDPKTKSKADVATSETAAIFSLVERISTDPAVSIERVEQAFAFYQKVQADQARKAFTVDFIACQEEMEPVRKNADNPLTNKKYASYEALDRATRPIYTKHGFAVSFDTAPSPNPEHVLVLMTLMHKGGHERQYHVDMPADGKGPRGNDVMTKTHATGSAYTYGKRYCFGNAFNIATFTDDDGNAASKKPAAPPQSGKLNIAESTTERDVILSELTKLSRPLSPEDKDDFVSKYAARIDKLMKSDADVIRAEFKKMSVVKS